MSTLSPLVRYRVVSRLGAGGMSTVDLAEDTRLGRMVALKRMHAVGDAQATARLRREALIGASVSHPNLVSIYDIVAGETDELVIAMEYVEGETLRDALRRASPIAPDRSLAIAEGIAAALDTIHGQGVVHRDVTPANVLLARDGAVKLLDLGLATSIDRTRITSAGAVMGTYAYMAPEALEGAEPSPAADVYALAAVTFEMLAGRRARQEPNPLALAHAIATAPPPDLRTGWPEAPPAAAVALARGMARDPAARPESAGALVAELRSALDSAPPAPPAPPTARTDPRPSPGRPDRRGPRDRRPIIAAVAGATVAVAVVVAALALAGGPSHPRTGAAARTGPTRAASPAPTGTTAPARAGATPAATAPAGTPPSAPASAGAGRAAPAATGSPTEAVRAFYTLAAAHRFAAAWALADPQFRSQLGGLGSFEAGQAATRGVRFDALTATASSPRAATVQLADRSFHTDGTQRCAGTVSLRRGSGGWLLDAISITCR